MEARRGAVGALGSMEVKDVIEPLSKTLEDSDREVRYTAVFALATITGQWEWAASLELYMQDEQRYLNYWRKWLGTR